MAVFDIIPSNFFSVLVSGNREIYVEALLLLHHMFKFELNIKVDDYISSLISLQEDKDFNPEEDDELPEGGLTPSGKARLILNRFIKTGWVEKEFLEGSFVEIITPQPYAIPVMKLLDELGKGGVKEYNSLVFSTYSGLKQAKEEQKSQMYEAVLSAKSNTEQLEYQLRSLYHGIKSYLRNIEKENEVNQLLKDHFENYKQMSDRIYHPIKTMDSIHRYMTPIQNILTDTLSNEELMQLMCERAMTIKRYENELLAEEEIISAINYVLDAYQSLDDIINQIDRKHSTYTKSSIEKMRYIMTADQTIKGKLAQLLKAYANAENEQKEAIGELFEKNIRVNRQEFIDGKSLYHKNVRSRRIDAEPLKIRKDDGFSELAMNGMLEYLKNRYSVTRVKEFVNSLFKENKNSVESRDISIDSESNFIMLILAVVRANERGMNYKIEMNNGHVECNGYRIPNMVIEKKEGKGHVE
ncbi:MAG: DUF5716 family protein [Clostridia bacterium]|nr:DUF5716 family protein [Clostridia bacterium]